MKRPKKKRKEKILNCLVNDTLSDMLTRIRNAQLAKHNQVTVFNTKMNQMITEILYKEGFIQNYFMLTPSSTNGASCKPPREIILSLKYLTQAKIPCISKIQRISSPGLRLYSGYKDIPKSLNGMGVVILTTSKGVITDREARRLKLGGEILCSIC